MVLLHTPRLVTFQLPRGGCARYTASAFRASFVHCLGVDKAAIHLLIRRQLNRNIASQTCRDLTRCGPNLSRVGASQCPIISSIEQIQSMQLLNKQACSLRIHVQQGTMSTGCMFHPPWCRRWSRRFTRQRSLKARHCGERAVRSCFLLNITSCH